MLFECVAGFENHRSESHSGLLFAPLRNETLLYPEAPHVTCPSVPEISQTPSCPCLDFLGTDGFLGALEAIIL